MKPPQSKKTSSSAAHSKNLQREFSRLIEHLQADSGRVDDRRFRDVLKKSAEALVKLRSSIERFEREGERDKNPARAPVRSRRKTESSKAAGAGADKGARPPKIKTKAGAVTKGRATSKPRRATKDARPVEPRKKERRAAQIDAAAQPENGASAEAGLPPPKLEDPAIVLARREQQRREARAPIMPRGPAAPRPMPPQSGKPIWSLPHSG